MRTIISARQHLKKARNRGRSRSNSSSGQWDSRARSPIFFDQTASHYEAKPCVDKSFHGVLQNTTQRIVAINKGINREKVCLPQIGSPSFMRAAAISATPQCVSPIEGNKILRIDTAGSAKSNSSSSCSQDKDPRGRRAGKTWIRRRARQLMRRRRRKKETDNEAAAAASCHSSTVNV